ncbi:hypothetical protein CEXT_696771 [Caerostris extrusa]|uniref:Uncharacterized protein n=1 Tax=Caerostris extrusa TaxID=172846 RepID=A0AAV4SZC1_CAEEX|nr:hypothetical protein CEXT_696771 [Caerostris extrusa]
MTPHSAPHSSTSELEFGYVFYSTRTVCWIHFGGLRLPWIHIRKGWFWGGCGQPIRGSEAFLPVFCRRKGTRRSFATTGDKTLTPHRHTPLHLLHPFQRENITKSI